MDTSLPPHAHTLRKGRFSQSFRSYLVTTCTRDRLPIFHDWLLGRLIVNEMRALHELGWLDSQSFVVMPDHIHWLFSLGDLASLSMVMRRFKGRSSMMVNRVLGGEGSIWQRGYHDRAIRHEEDIRAVARYIVANPLRAGLVDDIGDYPLWDAKWL
ncbi:REP-associated tyrosine transposase [Litchfieldella rifensis]|uniref:Transposase n=1 Tax=Litchfieldella rifensis TaxID=762643 RepID=A0ABV7LSQ9_9GAMM